MYVFKFGSKEYVRGGKDGIVYRLLFRVRLVWGVYVGSRFELYRKGFES